MHRGTPISFLQKCVISITGSLTPSSISFAQRTLAYLRNKEGGNANEARTVGLYAGSIAAILFFFIQLTTFFVFGAIPRLVAMTTDLSHAQNVKRKHWFFPRFLFYFYACRTTFCLKFYFFESASFDASSLCFRFYYARLDFDVVIIIVKL